MEHKTKPGWRPWKPPLEKRDRRERWGLRGKTVWDWLNLLVVPVMLALVAGLFTTLQIIYQSAAETQFQRFVEEFRVQEASLQAYLDLMATLLLEHHLTEADVGSEVRAIARAQTLTTLRKQDAEGKGTVVGFLYDAGLIKRSGTEGGDGAIVDLENADLSEANLRLDNLSEADLSEADLSDANLSDTVLFGANLGGANLSDGLDVDSPGAILQAAGLQGAYLGDANLARADLEDANLFAANLSDGLDVDSRGAILQAADLQNANLKYANLEDVNLEYANLSKADLSKADLTEANLTGAKGVTQQKLEEHTQKLEGAIMPDGSIYED